MATKQELEGEIELLKFENNRLRYDLRNTTEVLKSFKRLLDDVSEEDE
jgi:hypothetical protein